MIIVRYLIRETIKSQLAVFFILFLVFLSQKFISILAKASDGDIPAGFILTFVGLNMPAMGAMMLPLSIYVGILITFGRLYAESEITVMNATGIGNKFLIQAAFYLALITAGAAAFNSLWLTPWALDKRAEIMEQLESDTSVELLQTGQFQKTPDGTAVVFIDDLENKVLSDVFVAQIVPKDALLPSVMIAKTGVVNELDDGRQILTLSEGTRYEGVPTRLDYMITKYKQYDALIGQREVKKGGRDWEDMPTLTLLQSSNRSAQAELQWRLSLIASIPLLTLIVIPLSAVNPRQGRFAKIGPALLIYMAYFLAISASKSAIEEGTLPVVVGMWPVNIAMLMAGLGLNYMDSIPVRKLKDKFRQKRLAKRV
ncbi:LPS export ABC transporter permease LptF [Vibrio sp. SCSIO 43137]|uniref:LPS export ABC transporter permease LptF n=1 Tax=Vibrio sp. SCSIO 43137 TaxID=3021011 RepID=UPI002307712D|nr:LPS export ABC transporter permease LptF [Vibrio sp. SCSIO 43137]WCE30056.1 LPS export ABC transporter permease LptF [Vibrio sp. SCSIO 43137]